MRANWLSNIGHTIPIKYHVVFWLGYFSINVIRWGSYFNDYIYSLKSNLVEFPLHIIIVYVNIYYLIPKFVVKKKIGTYIFTLLFSLGIVYVLRTGLNYLLVTKNIWPEAYGVQKAFSFNHITAVVIGELYVIALVTAIKLTFDWVHERNRSEQLQKMQLKTELSFLKSQIQPHFFFNTLNNLYALTLEKSDKASNVVLKLSEMMRYILYDAQESRINLTDEINYIQGYIELEQLRHGSHIVSNIEIAGNIDFIKIPPLLLLPFIENCFKHGKKNNDNLKVYINFENLNNTNLYFKVLNTFEDSTQPETKHGIGIENVKRRLELLYGNKFELQTKINEREYIVELKIPLQ